jgi:glucuronokinase
VPVIARTYARAALAGNPSDAYGGRTLAACLADWAADVELAPASELRVEPASAELEDLVRAALTRLVRRDVIATPTARVRVQTTIPPQVGLAGSSAIVIAVMRAACAAFGGRLEPRVMAAEALAAEVEELGIAAGPQDRFVQTHEGLLDMDFASGRLEPLDPSLLPPMLVAHRVHPGRHSGASHAALRARFENGDAVVRAVMTELAAVAARAADALRAGDRDAFARALDASFDLRTEVMEVDPDEAEGIAIARRLGAAANYAGSGGAVVVLPEPGSEDALAAAFAAADWDARPLHVAPAR